MNPSKSDFYFLPLGGCNEIGMNLNLFGHDNQWLMVDLGVSFYDKAGIDVIMPNPSAILERLDQLQGLVLTHAHEDHIGAIPYLWPMLRCPLYATPFTAEVIRKKISEYNWKDEVHIIEVPLGGVIEVGAFSVEFVTLTHSIPEPSALVISTPAGKIFHSADWKIDDAPQIGETIDVSVMEGIGKRGIDAMLCDSTNVFREDPAGSEEIPRVELERIIAGNADKRIIVACFASNVARVESVAMAAKAAGRKVALLGRSLDNMTTIAKKCGYMKKVPGFIDVDEALSLPKEKVLFISTGSQGEFRAALGRISRGQHRFVKVEEDDLIIFSSRVIPGNEKNISQMQNELIYQGATLITAHDENIHVSGHPSRSELLEMYKWINPKVLIPLHGDAHHIQAQAALARGYGIKRVIEPRNGTLINMVGKNPGQIDVVEMGRWCVDGALLKDMDSPSIKERQNLSYSGLVSVSLCVDSNFALESEPLFEFFGLADDAEDREHFTALCSKAIDSMDGSFFKNENQFVSQVKQHIRRVIGRECGHKPFVGVHVHVA